MGAPKLKWTEEEEVALKAGVLKHGVGKWRAIQKDPKFKGALSARTNVDLKDKWRNLNIDPTAEVKTVGHKRGRARPEVESGRMKRAAGSWDSDVSSPRHIEHSNGSHEHVPEYADGPESTNPATHRLQSPNKILKRVEDMIVAAVIALNGEGGSPVVDVTQWVKEHCFISEGIQSDLQTTLASLVSRKRLVLAAGRYSLGGHVRRYAMDEKIVLSSGQSFSSFPARMKAKRVAEIAASAARAVAEAEDAAEHAVQLVADADRIKLSVHKHQAGVHKGKNINTLNGKSSRGLLGKARQGAKSVNGIAQRPGAGQRDVVGSRPMVHTVVPSPQVALRAKCH